MSREVLQGVLCMNKPAEFTSHDVIAKLRGILHMRRLGHTGTLDPMATGVLPILVGTATRAFEMLPDQTKTYRASVRFGWETDTEDIWGRRTASYPQMHVTRDALEEAMPQFIGEIQQKPPMYSAVSVGGKRLYKLARQGIEIERESRTVRIDRLTLENWDEPSQTAEFLISCGKGTYIRTLLADIGKTLGGGGVMTALCRTKACGFTLEQCFTFDDVMRLCRSGEIADRLIPTDRLFFAYPDIHLSAEQTEQYRNGIRLPLDRLENVQTPQKNYRVYGASGAFLGISLADFDTGLLCVLKNFSVKSEK